MHEAKKPIKAKYAQLVSSLINQYDASLIFYEAKPVQKNKDSIEKYEVETEEVARITLPHRALKELSDLLVKQLSEGVEMKNESDLIPTSSKKRKKK